MGGPPQKSKIEGPLNLLPLRGGKTLGERGKRGKKAPCFNKGVIAVCWFAGLLVCWFAGCWLLVASCWDCKVEFFC